VKGIWIVAAVGLLVALVLGGVLSPFASPRPDGLERVAEDKGFAEKGQGEPVMKAPMPDYTIPSVRNGRTSARLGGVIGTLLAFGLGLGAAVFLRAFRARAPRPAVCTPSKSQIENQKPKTP
jgi:cobalt/nickel transport protein